jgi:erythromycin esterase
MTQVLRVLAILALAGAAAGCGSDNTTALNADAAGALTWINGNATQLATLAPATTTTDLAPLGAMVGTARLVGMGEATHGSHEFFTMKNRVFQYLVTTKGFTGFAIEATMPEAMAMDQYVRTGKGDPEVLLSHLYFWTWNTSEVLDLVKWMRSYNDGKPASQQVGFYAFDMQYPGIAMDSVAAYLNRVAPDLGGEAGLDYFCLSPYRNDSFGRFQQKSYASAGAAVWTPCTPLVAGVYSLFTTNAARLRAASSDKEFATAQQMARLVVEYEQNARGVLTRDDAMAENAAWLLDQAGPNAKLFLWAHDFHISRYAGSMGANLAQRLGSAYLPIGFFFYNGGLNAFEADANGNLVSLHAMTALPAPDSTYESVMAQASWPNYYFDARTGPADVRRWLAGPGTTRTVGAVFAPSIASFGFQQIRISEEYDVAMFIKTVTPSTLLPFRN